MVSQPDTNPDLSRPDSELGTQDLPPLSNREAQLLSAFMVYRFDMVTLAEREKLHPAQLLAFARSPTVQAHIAALKSFADQAFALRAVESRTVAIDILEEVAKTSDNQIERRRAASNILRGLGGPSHRGGSRPPSSPAAGGRGAALRGGEGSVSTTPTQPPFTEDSTPSPPSPPIPRLTPSPEIPPDRIAHRAMRACIHLSEHDDNRATLETLLAPGARFNHQPITDLAGQAPTFHPSGAISIVPIGPPSETTSRLRLTSPHPPHFLFTLTRSETGPHPNSWLISEIHEDTG